jgi:hypothetical protein
MYAVRGTTASTAICVLRSCCDRMNREVCWRKRPICNNAPSLRRRDRGKQNNGKGSVRMASHMPRFETETYLLWAKLIFKNYKIFTHDFRQYLWPLHSGQGKNEHGWWGLELAACSPTLKLHYTSPLRQQMELTLMPREPFTLLFMAAIVTVFNFNKNKIGKGVLHYTVHKILNNLLYSLFGLLSVSL